jgi:hypothetical protein
VNILELLPQYFLYIFFAVLAVIIGLIVLSIWSNIAPAAPGVVLGYLEIVGTYAGGKLFKRFEGTIVDASNIFLNTQYEDEFKESLLADLELLKLKEQNPAGLELKNVKDEFGKCRLNEMCRVLVTREKLFTKHIFVQWGHLGSLSEYAAKEEKPKFTLSNLFVSRGAVRGQLYTFPTKWDIEDVGTCQVHLFKPEAVASEKEETVDVPTFLAKVALNIPSVVEFREQLKSWQEKYRDLRREYLKVLSATSTVATERDFYRSLSSKIGTEPVLTPAPMPSPPKSWTWKDIALGGVPALAGYCIAQQYYTQYDPLIGALIGLGIGLFLAWRRRQSE